jgi:hypothetical protein
MKVKIIEVANSEDVAAFIRKGKASEMPSIQQEWRFNFGKQLKKLKNATGYLLVTEETPHIIEGGMIFQLANKEVPYMAFVEVAPHNKAATKKHDHVAGCLIAYAYQLSLIEGVGPYKGYLQFDVEEERKEDEIKLMGVYSSKYHAKHKLGSTTMVIADEDGDALIAKYLEYGKSK